MGVAYAKGLAMATGKPLVGVNHLEGHIFANVFADPEVRPPLVALLVSGGHTSLVHMPEWGVYHTLGETLDDAAGEAFDKVAKVLGLGYPGGPVLSRLAEQGDAAAIDFPRAMMKSGDYAFSLSGLKTAVLTYIRHEEAAGRQVDVPDLAASFQQAVIDVQVAKAVRAVQETGAVSFCLGGGVAANRALREALTAAIEPLGVHVSVPPLELCTDNAAMIAAAAHYRYLRGERLSLEPPRPSRAEARHPGLAATPSGVGRNLSRSHSTACAKSRRPLGKAVSKSAYTRRRLALGVRECQHSREDLARIRSVRVCTPRHEVAGTVRTRTVRERARFERTLSLRRTV